MAVKQVAFSIPCDGYVPDTPSCLSSSPV